VSGYRTLVDVYEWLIPEDKLSPAGSVAAFAGVLQYLPIESRVLDCSCGTGQLAVGLAEHGMVVDATDASPGMVRRTQQLAEARHVPVTARTVAWSELHSHFAPSTYDLVLCVGNSIAHAEGTLQRVAALQAMARLLRPAGRLVLTSRNWELVRARGTRMDIADQVVRRGAVEGVVIYNWQIEDHWEKEHHLEIAVAQVASDGAVLTTAERLSFWPFKHDDLVSELRSIGLAVDQSTFNPTDEGYTVVATPG
jgi:SAM-dependent methyltransferase